jgi:hypothetical protein
MPAPPPAPPPPPPPLPLPPSPSPSPSPPSTAVPTLTLLLLLILTPPSLTTIPSHAAAQTASDVMGPGPWQEDMWTAPRWVGDVTFAASNALLAGVTAGVSQRLRGGEFGDGFARGAVAGVVAYAGRRVGAQRFDTLRVGGYTLTPEAMDGDGWRDYWGTWLDPQPLDLSELVHHAPRVHGIGYIPEAVSFGVHQRVGPDTMVVAAGDTVALATDPGVEPSRPPDHSQWHLEIASQQGFRITRDGTGDVPAMFLVPADWLAWAYGEPVRVRLSIRRQWDGEDPGAAYWWRLGVSSDLQWILIWE